MSRYDKPDHAFKSMRAREQGIVFMSDARTFPAAPLPEGWTAWDPAIPANLKHAREGVLLVTYTDGEGKQHVEEVPYATDKPDVDQKIEVLSLGCTITLRVKELEGSIETMILGINGAADRAEKLAAEIERSEWKEPRPSFDSALKSIKKGKQRWEK